MTPEALRRRMAHGNIYAAEKVDAALGELLPAGQPRRRCASWPCCGSPTGSTRRSQEYRERPRHRPSRGRRASGCVVAVTGAPGGEHLIRRAARIADAHAAASCSACTSTPQDGLAGPRRPRSTAHRELLDELGGAYHEVVGDDVAEALVEFARAENATQLVLGRQPPVALAELDPRLGHQPRDPRLPAPIDVHVIADEPGRPRTTAAACRRRHAGRHLAAAPAQRRRLAARRSSACPLLTVVLVARARRPRPARRVLLLYLAARGRRRRVGGARGRRSSRRSSRSLLVNWFFTPPLHTLHHRRAREPRSPSSSFLVVAGARERAGRRSRRGAAPRRRARAEAEALARSAAVVGDRDPLPALVDQLRAHVRARRRGVLVARRRTALDGRGRASAPVADLPRPRRRRRRRSATTRSLVVARPALATPTTAACCTCFAAQLGAALERRRLAGRGGRRPTRSPRPNELRTALLRAVSHDLRTPLASIKASVTSLLQRRRRLAAEAGTSSSRPSTRRPTGSTALVGNLLDMSRLQTGALDVRAASPSGSRRSCPRRSPASATRAGQVDGRRARDLPAVDRRPRAARAGRGQPGRPTPSRYSPPAERVRVEAGAVGDRGRPARRRPRPGHPAARPRAGCSAVPAPRRRGRRRRGRARPGRRARLRRGHGRRAHARRHARRRAHRWSYACRPRGAPRRDPRDLWSSTTSRRSCRALGTNLARPRLRGRPRRRPARTALALAGRAPPRRRSSSTSACPASTASR